MKRLFLSRRSRRFLITGMMLSLLISGLFGGTRFIKAAAPSTSISTSALTASVNTNGAYAIVSSILPWTFQGHLHATLTNIAVNSGSDGIGSYQELDFNYTDKSAASRSGGIRLYRAEPVVLFLDSYVTSAPNTTPFPIFTSYPSNLYRLTYNYAFAQRSYSLLGADSPWIYFDGQANTFILSPASDFVLSSTKKLFNGAISTGISSTITTLPAGFTHKTMLVINSGITATQQMWGLAMTSMQGKVRPANDADVILNKLGYWTDHGATYYYNYDPTLGYTGTLLAVAQSFTQQGIPLGYLQLDSWWYPKGSSDTWQGNGKTRGGIYTYAAAPTLFPGGLSAFQQQLGLPLLTHARWVDASSPYRSQYLMSNNVSIDPAYWSATASYLQSSAVVGYEQDWLSSMASTNFNLSDPNTYFGDMSSAMQADNINIQYCTPLPRHFLQSTLYNNVTTIRVSPDRFNSSNWDYFLYGSQLASDLGLWPWSDVFMSTETSNLLISTLSAGPVGVGDPIGAESASNLFQTIRADGVIVKPDVPLTPVDSVYIQDAQSLQMPMIAATYSDFGGGMKPFYVLSYARNSTNTALSFTPASLGITGNAYVYNYFTGTGMVVTAGNAFTDTVTTGGSYYIVVPIGASGIAFLGDAGKFVSLGKKRISQLSDTGIVKATVTFASNETSLTLHGYSPTQPNITSPDGVVGMVNYDPTSGLFNFTLSPGANGTATVSIGTM